MKNYREIQQERKSHNKGLWYSIGLHALIIALIFLPFINQEDKQPEYEDVIVVDFSSGSSLKGATASNASANEAPNTEHKTTKVIKQVKSTPPKKVLTQKKSDITVPKVKTPPKRIPDEYRKSPQRLENNSENSAEVVSTKKSEIPKVKPVPVSKDNGDAGTGNSDNGQATTEGSATDNSTGSGNADSGNGKSDSGAGEDNRGDGLFGNIGELSRSVVYRPDISKMIQENSIVKVRLCISRSGRVVDYAYEPEGSKVSNEGLVQKTLYIVSKYRFEKVAYGPKLECGIYTIKVDMSNL